MLRGRPCLKRLVGFVAARALSSSVVLCKKNATPNLPVPWPTSSVPAQGETAATAVEQAKRMLEALQQEKKKGLSVISGLEEYRSSRITDAERSEVGNRLWRDFRIDVQNVAEANAELDDHKEDLKSVDTQLVEARKQLTLAMKAQVPQVC